MAGAPIVVLAAPGEPGDALAAALRLSPDGAPAVLRGPDDPEEAAAVLSALPGARAVHVVPDVERPGPAPEADVHVDAAALLADPAGELRALCAALHLTADQGMRSPLEALTAEPGAASFASVHSDGFAEAVAATGGSLLLSTYQANRLVGVHALADGLRTHFREAPRPMGLAVGPDRLAVGTRTEVWDLREVPELLPRLPFAAAHDACFVPRRRHVTGDVQVHEMGFAGGRLHLAATALSCVATLDEDHSVVPVWRPPFVSAVAPGDRCHLNGLAVVEDAVRFVTCLGQTDEPGAWRADKAHAGVLLEVPSGEVVAGGLSMPHSPRVHDGRLWVLQSGLGELSVVDPATGTTETVARLPGFTRGLATVGRTAFVGLSQIRETASFADLPISRSAQERQCGVWAVDLVTGAVAGFLRFEALVQELFDVALVPGRRAPEILEPDDELTATTYALP